MNAKQWLGRGRWIEREIAALMRTRDETRDRLTKITQSYDGDGAQSTKDPHKFDALVEMEDKLDAAIDKLYQTKNEILSAIGQLEDGRERIALTMYYVTVYDTEPQYDEKNREKERRMITWEDVASKQHYTWRQMMRIKKAAYAHMEDVISCHIGGVV